MREIRTSKLSELRSVFNSSDDNIHFYRLLDKSFNLNEFNVIFAKPVKKNNFLISWRADVQGEIRNVNDINPEERDLVGNRIQKAFNQFEEKSKSFRDLSADFIQKIQEIPSFDSVLVSVNSDDILNIIITDWGFLPDDIDRKSGLLQSIFPSTKHSILAKIVSFGGNPISGKNIHIKSKNNNNSDVSDRNGLVRLGGVTRGERFSLTDDDGNILADDLIADGTLEYIIQVERNIKLKFKLVCTENGATPRIDRINFYSSTLGDITLTSNSGNEFEIVHPDIKDHFIIRLHDVNIFEDSIPQSDRLFTIRINCNPTEKPDPSDMVSLSEEQVGLQDDTHDITNLVFKNAFGRPIKGLDISVLGGQDKETWTGTTDEEGIVRYKGSNGEKELHFQRLGTNWSQRFIHTTSDGPTTHIFRSIPLFPWIWWILILLFFILLLCCHFDWRYCHFCEDSRLPSETVIHEDAFLHENDHVGENIYDEGTSVEMRRKFDERRDSLGGTKGIVTVSLRWHTMDDLDLHVIEPNGTRIYFENPSSEQGGKLDIDMNSEFTSSESPMENIYYQTYPSQGRYEVEVVLYERKTTPKDIGIPYEVYISIGDREYIKKGIHSIESQGHLVFRFDI